MMENLQNQLNNWPDNLRMALGLTLWCLLIITLVLSDALIGGSEEVYAEIKPGGSYEPGTIEIILYLMWPIYVSVFLAFFMKERFAQVFWVLVTGLLPASALVAFVSVEYLPEAIDGLFLVLVFYETIMFLASMVYWGNYWYLWLTGESSPPSLKAVSLQLFLLVAFLLIGIIVTY